MSTLNPSSDGDPSAEPKQTRPASTIASLILMWGGHVSDSIARRLRSTFRQRQVATADTNELAVQTVAVVSPIGTTPHSGLDLPAEVKPWQEASIYSRVNGYLKDWFVDIGAHVEQISRSPMSTYLISISNSLKHVSGHARQKNFEQAKARTRDGRSLSRESSPNLMPEHRYLPGHK